MSDNEIAERVAVQEQKIISLEHRTKKLEENTEALVDLTSSIKMLAYKQEEATNKIYEIDKKVTSLERQPADKWNKVVGYITAALVSGIIGALISYFVK